MKKLLSMAILATLTVSLSGLLAACGGEDITCGDGTEKVDGVCKLLCGANQYWDGTACKPNKECATGTTFNAATGKCEPSIKSCADGTTLTNGTCVPQCSNDQYYDTTSKTCIPVPACAPGTKFNPNTNKCEPDAASCAAGTHFQGGKCIPDVTCGTGTHAEGGKCVANRLPTPEVPEANEPNDVFNHPATSASTAFSLPAAGGQITLGGTIQTPTDFNTDGTLEADWDDFEFQTDVDGVYLRISATSEGATLPAFYVLGVDWVKGELTYARYAINPNGLVSEREVFLPAAGNYIIAVSDYNNAVNDLFNTTNPAVGGDDFTYFITVSRLEAPQFIPVTVPATETGNFDDGSIKFYSMSSLTPDDVIQGLSAGQPNSDASSDVYPILALISPVGPYNEVAATGFGKDTTIMFLAGSGEHLMIQDYLIAIGPNRAFQLDFIKRTPVVCGGDPDPCATGDLEAGKDGVYLFTLPANEIFFHSAMIPSGSYFDIFIDFLAPNGMLFAQGESYYYQDWYTGDEYWYPSATLFHVPMDVTVIARIYEAQGQEVIGFTQSPIHIAESLLVEGPNGPFTPTRFPAMTYFNGGFDQFDAIAGQVYLFTNYTHQGTWIEPVTMLADTSFNDLTGVDSDGYSLDIPLFSVPMDGRYIHNHYDYDYDGVGDVGDYTVDMSIVTPDTLETPAEGTPVISSPSLGLKGSTAFMFVTEAGAGYGINVAPTSASTTVVPEVRVFFYGITDGWSIIADPMGLLTVQQSIITGTAGQPADTGWFAQPYPMGGAMLVLVRNTSGAPVETDAVDITLSKAVCLPGGYKCSDDATIVQLCENNAWVDSVTCGEGTTCTRLDATNAICATMNTIDAIPYVSQDQLISGDSASWDVYEFSIDADRPVNFETFQEYNAANPSASTCANLDSKLYVYNITGAVGVQVGYNDDAGIGMCSKIAALPLTAGSYLIFVRTYSTSSPEYPYTLVVN